MRKIWQLIAVSIAAQVATFPLGILYFHQFPNFFIISNLVVIPAAFLILYGAVILFIFSPIEFILKGLGFLLNLLLYFLNYTVSTIEQLPFSLLQGISITVIETWLLYMLIITFIFYLLMKRIFLLGLSTFIVGVFSCIFLFSYFERINKSRFLVYNIPNTTAVDFISGHRNLLIADSSLLNNRDQYMFYVQHYHDDHNLKNPVLASNLEDNLNVKERIKAVNNFVVLPGFKIFHLNKEYDKVPAKIPAEILLVSNVKDKTFSAFLNINQWDKIIFDSSVNTFKAKKWKKICEDTGADCHAVSVDGYFYLEKSVKRPSMAFK